MAQHWEVVGGSDKGGILVRDGLDLKSSQISARLSTGALVKELQLVGDRLQYELIEGEGPPTGWVSLSIKGKELLVKSDKIPSPSTQTIFDFDIELADGSIESLQKYTSPVTVIVNTASACGFTKQYAGLQKLHQDFGQKGLNVLAFPCNQFGAQEPGKNCDIQDFVKDKFEVAFPVFGKTNVNDPESNALYKFLKKSVEGPVPRAPWAKDLFPDAKDIQWNFTKFLCVKGKPFKRYSFSVDPSAMVADIESALASASASPAPASTRPSAFAAWKAPVDRKPRIFCFHGTACGEDIFRIQLGALLQALKDKYEFVFIEGPEKIEQGPAYEMMQQFFPGKKNCQYDQVSLDKKGWRSYNDPKKALEYLQSELKSRGPVDGLLGFSQGANFAAMLAAQAYAGTGVPIGFSILLGPNAPGYVDQMPEIFSSPIEIPTLIVRGDKEGYGAGMDALFAAVEKEGHFTLDKKGAESPADHVRKLFSKCEYVTHTGDHKPLPSVVDERKKIIESIKSFLEAQVKV